MAPESHAVVMLSKENFEALTLYEVLGLKRGAAVDAGEVKRRYRRLSLRFHPDKDPSPEARRCFEKVKLAEQTLSDPLLRKKYDDDLVASTAGPSKSAADVESLNRAAENLKRSMKEDTEKRASAERRMEQQRQAQDAMRKELEEETPAEAIEKDLISHWDVDPLLLRMKELEVLQLLARLGGAGAKRVRDDYYC